ncbi:MAG: hypothetical protein HZA80_03315 [Candidatus Taylorbacteria bacterium]|nr:hypothetical protein [Candidatus Taylorbacteria bacterium]
MEPDLKQFHTWHLIRAILLRASAQYHSAGISSGRSHASYVYDAWALTFPYSGPQLLDTPIEKLRDELLQRDPLIKNGQQVFCFDLRGLSSAEITAVTIHCMAECHSYLSTDGYHLHDAVTATDTVIDFFGKVRADLAGFIPRNLEKRRRHLNPSEIPELKGLVEELNHRRDLIVIDPYKGIQPKS